MLTHVAVEGYVMITADRTTCTLWWRYTNGLLHSANDRPATKGIDHTRTWYRYGIVHRDNDLPAKVNGRPAHLRKLTAHVWGEHGCARWTNAGRGGNQQMVNGNEFAWRKWYINGKMCREDDGPTTELLDAQGYTRMWEIKNGVYHRTDGLPAIIKESANGEWIELGWYKRDKLHRGGDSPAYASSWEVQWNRHGKGYRTDGPYQIDYSDTASSKRWQYLYFDDEVVDSRYLTQAEIDAYGIGDERENVWG